MTKIDFYVLSGQASGDRFQLASKIAKKAVQQGHRVLIHTESNEQALLIDQLLWTSDELSFLPHGIIGESDKTLSPILIGNGHIENDEHDVLINLAEQVPTFFSRYKRLAECVDNDNKARAASRSRFKFYRDRGYPLSTHEIG